MWPKLASDSIFLLLCSSVVISDTPHMPGSASLSTGDSWVGWKLQTLKNPLPSFQPSHWGTGYVILGRSLLCLDLNSSVCAMCYINNAPPLLTGLLVEFDTITQTYHRSQAPWRKDGHYSYHCWHLTWHREVSFLAWDSQTYFSILLKLASPSFLSKLGSSPPSLLLPQAGLLTWQLALSAQH